jgi:hypothetical protein
MHVLSVSAALTKKAKPHQKQPDLLTDELALVLYWMLLCLSL